MGLEGHPLYNMLPEVNNTKYQLRRKSAVKPRYEAFYEFFCKPPNFKYEFAPWLPH